MLFSTAFLFARPTSTSPGIVPASSPDSPEKLNRRGSEAQSISAA
ncbi:MAG: hypothetical protein WC765_03000 [Phycisphaerae bacterium]